MYRVCIAENAEPIREWAIEFVSETLNEDIDPGYFIGKWRDFIKMDMGIVYYLSHDEKVVGGIGALKVPSLLSGKTELIEVFWYVTPKHRRMGMALYEAMNQYFMNNIEIKRFAMIHMEQSMPEKLKRFYELKGFRLLETHWVKDKVTT